MLARLLIVCALVVAVTSRAEGTWSMQLGVEGGLDTNPGRHYQRPQTAVPLTSVLGGVQGWWRGGPVFLLGSYDVGARFFPTVFEESTVAQVAHAEAGLLLHRTVALVGNAAAKDRRGQREYSDLNGGVGLRWMPDAQLEVTLVARLEGFWFRPDPRLDFFAPGASIAVRYRFDRRHQLTLFGEGAERSHRGLARESDFSEPTRARHDTLMSAGAGYFYRGPVILSLGYDVLSLESNSFGETLLRHRATARLGVPLPLDLMLFGHLTLQLAQYPDGIYASPELFLLEDAENQNALSLELSRPLSNHLDLALRYGVFQNRLGGNDLHYLRQVVSLGVTWRR